MVNNQNCCKVMVTASPLNSCRGAMQGRNTESSLFVLSCSGQILRRSPVIPVSWGSCLCEICSCWVWSGSMTCSSPEVHGSSGWFMLRFDRKQQNSIKQLSVNKKINKKKLHEMLEKKVPGKRFKLSLLWLHCIRLYLTSDWPSLSCRSYWRNNMPCCAQVRRKAPWWESVSICRSCGQPSVYSHQEFCGSFKVNSSSV